MLERAPRGLPLSERKRDWFFVVAFALFTVIVGVTRPIRSMTGAMTVLAGGDMSVE